MSNQTTIAALFPKGLSATLVSVPACLQTGLSANIELKRRPPACRYGGSRASYEWLGPLSLAKVAYLLSTIGPVFWRKELEPQVSWPLENKDGMSRRGNEVLACEQGIRNSKKCQQAHRFAEHFERPVFHPRDGSIIDSFDNQRRANLINSLCCRFLSCLF